MKFKGDIIFTVFIILLAWDLLGIGNIVSGIFSGFSPSVS